MPAKRNATRKTKKGPKTRRSSKIRRATIPGAPRTNNYSLVLTPEPVSFLASQSTVGVIDINTGGGASRQLGNSALVASLGGGALNNYDFGSGWAFQHTDLFHTANFATMFDAYRIDKIDITIDTLLNINVLSSTSGGGAMPTVYYIADDDDGNTPTTAVSVLSHERVRKHAFGSDTKRSHTFSITPKFASSVYAGAFAGYSPKTGWVDSAYTTIEHYGLKMWFTDVYCPGVSGVVSGFKFTVKYHMSFRGNLLAS